MYKLTIIDTDNPSVEETYECSVICAGLQLTDGSSQALAVTEATAIDIAKGILTADAAKSDLLKNAAIAAAYAMLRTLNAHCGEKGGDAN